MQVRCVSAYHEETKRVNLKSTALLLAAVILGSSGESMVGQSRPLELESLLGAPRLIHAH